MKPAPFDWLRAASLDEALQGLHEHGEGARILAGGQSLMAMLNMRLVRPEVIVDIGGLDELRYLKVDGDMLEVGAATTQVELERWPELGAKTPLLAAAMPHIGHFQTRNRGTVCGSLSHADPSSELPLCLALLGGEVVLRDRKRRRVLPADEFQVGMLQTARRPDEITVAARFPLHREGWGYAFREVARRHGDFAVVALAAMSDGHTHRLAVGGVADRPTVREWQGLETGDLADALNEFAWEMHGTDDIHASARYRRDLVRRLGSKVIEEAIACR